VAADLAGELVPFMTPKRTRESTVR
jgi:hypothetical protein